MKKEFLLIICCFIIITFLAVGNNFNLKDAPVDINTQQNYRTIRDTVQKGETVFDIFKKHNLDMGALFKLKEASADVYKLGEVYPDHRYKISLSDMNRINSFDYWIDDDSILNITRNESGFSAEKIAVEYEKRIQHIGGLIKDNLISSIGEGRGNLMLALNLSDIFAWDIDFTTDLRNDDMFKIVVEGLYLNGNLKKYGDILSAEFINNGVTYRAYKFEYNGKAHYYGEDGKSLRKAFLKAPLSFRRISSRFSNGRYHPILKIYRPHHGLDYTAPAGTPVSAISDGTINFSGYKGQYGKLVVIRHANGWKTYYGHLSRINRGIKKGLKVEQGQVIGYVGATGLATGPHLHYEIRIKNRPVNPLVVKLPRGASIPKTLMAEFRQFKNQMDSRFASIMSSTFAFDKKGRYGNL
jgi:murein DD-endopeptidase MepM/ murein hydrolase activator NlpD